MEVRDDDSHVALATIPNTQESYNSSETFPGRDEATPRSADGRRRDTKATTGAGCNDPRFLSARNNRRLEHTRHDDVTKLQNHRSSCPPLSASSRVNLTQHGQEDDAKHSKVIYLVDGTGEERRPGSWSGRGRGQGCDQGAWPSNELFVTEKKCSRVLKRTENLIHWCGIRGGKLHPQSQISSVDGIGGMGEGGSMVRPSPQLHRGLVITDTVRAELLNPLSDRFRILRRK